ncbi:hypothetical protein BGZ80_002364 [Entomortierella chlamydospora]|uniref:Uncharacterized protein n=1 Tax=Entomortierella chlamydospora TaxID=101097 RepID=A0A9P6T365_9FUNG|nr:hypothetical protein BGZ80_002364 [Entomortierella chlamydospora]
MSIILPPYITTSSFIAPTASTFTSGISRTKLPTSTSLSSTDTNDKNTDQHGGMSGGAIAGIVIGILVVLVCSVVGAFYLLKRRRKRLMQIGRQHGCPDTYQSLGAISGFFSGVVAKARKATSGNSPSPLSSSTRGVAKHQKERAQSPTQMTGHERMLDRGAYSPTPGMTPAHRSTSPFPTHQSGVLPPSGSLVLPPLDQSDYMQQQPLLYQQQQPLLCQQQPLQQPLQQPTLAQSITTPASQPYSYQPGTGLVSVPLTLPPAQHHHQQHHHQQVYAQPPIQFSPQPYQPAPGAGNFYSAPPMPVTSVPQQLPYQQQVAPGIFSAPPPPPPPPSSVAVSQARSISPDPTTVFLPGDASRPLLGQGLFKIVPDAEDEEESKRAAAAAEQPSSSIAPLELNLDGDLISSVITYENQDQRFQALETSRTNTPTHNASASGMGRQGFDDKQELDEEDDDLGSSQQDTPHDIVIVGSDIVLEPLPSEKARAKAKAIADAANASQDAATENDRKHEPLPSTSSPASRNQAGPVGRGLQRVATIGSVLPTMGTEEYLERTDDKEEYSFGLHGDRRALAGSSDSMPKVVHPPTMTSLGRGAQGDIVSSAPTSSSTTTTATARSHSVPSPVVEHPNHTPDATSAVVPPPLARSTKPGLKNKY